MVDQVLKGWTPQIADAISLADAITLAGFKVVLVSVGLADSVFADKPITITDAIALLD